MDIRLKELLRTQQTFETSGPCKISTTIFAPSILLIMLEIGRIDQARHLAVALVRKFRESGFTKKV
jgi:hypothetical protein